MRRAFSPFAPAWRRQKPLPEYTMSGAYAAAVSGHGHHSVLAPGPLGHGAGGSPFDDDVPPWTPFNDALFPGGGGGLALWDAADGEGPLHAGALRLEDEVPLGAPRGSGIEPQVGEGSLAATPVWRCLLCAPLAPGAAPCTRCGSYDMRVLRVRLFWRNVRAAGNNSLY